MDKAIEPDRKSKPQRLVIVLASAFVAGIVAIIWAFARESLIRAMSNPLQAARLDVLRRHLGRH
jgi:uncharacterized protein involved in exopolysaccharide biosynthesis